MKPPSDSHPASGAWVVAITGGIGSGKSTVARLLADLGARVIDADAIAREVSVTPEVVRQIAAAFGPSILDATGAIDRAALAAQVFDDTERLATLNSIVHPPVRERIDKELAKWRKRGSDDASPLPGQRPLVVLDIPLLERTPFLRTASTVLFVDAPLEDRIQRVQHNRGWTAEELHRREAQQTKLTEKRRGADHVLFNGTGTAAEHGDEEAGGRDPASAVVQKLETLGRGEPPPATPDPPRDLADQPHDLGEQCRQLVELWCLELAK